MNPLYMFLVVVLPILGGAIIPIIPFSNRVLRCIYIEILVIINSALVLITLLNVPAGSYEVVHFTGDLVIAFRMDGMSMVFAGLIASLWPLATLYSFEYMKKDEHEQSFFIFYTMTYGVTLGIALASNLLTMYFFYELLTLVTVPLVVHSLTREAILATRKYLYYSLGGAAFAFMGLIFIIMYGSTNDFQLGGVINITKLGESKDILLLIYVMAFMGFGVKSALFPFNSWLPQAGVAPTPVTALLHAVAVVKSGAFAILRITYYSFGADFVRGTWAQNVVMSVVIVTIIYGCSRAVKETHIKRRLAYSTISNLSYVLFGVTIMTPLGMVGALCHMVFHAVMKIASFFCAGAIMHQTDRHYVYELNGLGYRMPIVFGVFTMAAFGLIGVPGLPGFISKWNLASAAVMSDNVMAYIGIAALLISALLTAIYMLSIVVRAYFPSIEFEESTMDIIKSGTYILNNTDEQDIDKNTITDPNWKMVLPLMVFAIVIIVFGLYSVRFVEFLIAISKGIY